ncbi:MAG TPA: DUF177 domain-containing protein [Candidatus Binataceae bacterium]|nr:DUF177 domain-containing protein [Candidatus Binataceae bacterium]
MKLRVDDITAEAKELSFAEPEADINRVLEKGPLTEFRVEEPIGVNVSYYRAGTELFFEGGLHAATTAICARCAEEFETSRDRDFRFVLAPKSIGFDDDKDLRDEDLEFSLYDGDQIDLSPLIREQFLLSLPTRPLCREDCRGLCPRCGINLNNGECSCSEETADPRLAALRNLKVGRSS